MQKKWMDETQEERLQVNGQEQVKNQGEQEVQKENEKEIVEKMEAQEKEARREECGCAVPLDFVSIYRRGCDVIDYKVW